MTDSDFEDAADFDIKDISSILKDIDSANSALDTIDVRADKLKASIVSLLQAQSLPNPYANVEPQPLENESDVVNVESSTTITSIATTTTTTTTTNASESNSCGKP
ncbi:hypothetical protein BGZ76_008914 [Entomortierella beljakovae]|nr:hypothetical protein BGZ76_008914 [Entomortierella beljakovae]